VGGVVSILRDLWCCLFWVVVGVVMCMCVGCLVFLLCGEWVVRLIVWVRGLVVLLDWSRV